VCSAAPRRCTPPCSLSLVFYGLRRRRGGAGVANRRTPLTNPRARISRRACPLELADQRTVRYETGVALMTDGARLARYRLHTPEWHDGMAGTAFDE
jgi:hypothetical protein